MGFLEVTTTTTATVTEICTCDAEWQQWPSTHFDMQRLADTAVRQSVG
jgi:hypothetical protein